MYTTHLPLLWYPQESELSKSQRAHHEWTLREAVRERRRHHTYRRLEHLRHQLERTFRRSPAATPARRA